MALTRVHNRLIAGAPVNVKDFGAVGDGVTDDTAAIQAALNADGDVWFPNGDYRCGATTLTKSKRLTASKSSTIIPNLGLGGGNLFYIQASNVTIEGFNIVGTGETFTPATGNTRIFLVGNGSTKYSNVRLVGNTITDASWSDGTSGPTNLTVTHGIYIQNVDNVSIYSNIINGISGAAVFAKSAISGLYIENNRFKDTRWYTVQLDFDVLHFSISHNTFISGTPEGVYWGGAVNIVSNVGDIRCEDGDIASNYFSGTHSYGAVIRVQSGVNIRVTSNILKNIETGSLSAGSLSGIRVTTRGIDSTNKQEPSQDIYIRDNYIQGPENVTATRAAIYINNDHWPARNVSFNTHITGNIISSPSATKYWKAGVITHGLSGGMENVWIENNNIEVFSQSGDSLVGGILTAGTNAGGLVDKVFIGGNTIKDIGTPASSYQYGIGIEAFSDNIINTKPNTIDNVFYGVRTFSGSGPTLERLDDQVFLNTTNDELFAVGLSLYGKPLEGEVTFDPPNLAAGTGTFKDVLVPNSGVGDFVLASFPTGTSVIQVTGNVRVAGSCRITFYNGGTTAVNLASGQLKARVFR